MPMNQIIQEKRKALGLTQEQVAESLNVSTPAVSKWETGASSPDVTLLAPLARLLKTDLNTLMCFDEGVSPKNVPQFCKKLHAIFQTEGLATTFGAAQQELHMYPHHEPLLLTLTLLLDSFLARAELSEEEALPYEEKISAWYQRLANSADDAISKSARSQLVSRYIRRGEFAMAQQALDAIPEKSLVPQNLPDKLMLQVVLDLRQGKADKAAGELQQALLAALNRVTMLLTKLTDAELAAGDRETARIAAESNAAMANLFGLWKCNAYTCSLNIALAEKDAEGSIRLLREMLETFRQRWDMQQAPLLRRVPGKVTQESSEMIFKMMVESIKTDPSFAFLRETDDWLDLMRDYQKK